MNLHCSKGRTLSAVHAKRDVFVRFLKPMWAAVSIRRSSSLGRMLSRLTWKRLRRVGLAPGLGAQADVPATHSGTGSAIAQAKFVVQLDPSVFIDPIPTGAGGIVRE